jgi:hypothetical protein
MPPYTMHVPPAWVYPRILLGAGHQLTPLFVAKHNITHVVNCAFANDCPEWWRKRHPGQYAELHAIDSMAVRILDWYPEFENWMRLFLRSSNGTVYVHCKAGVNRSAYLVLAFVSRNFGIDFNTLLSAVRKQRPIVCDNSAFMKQVKDELYGRVPSEEDTRNGSSVDGNA